MIPVKLYTDYKDQSRQIPGVRRKARYDHLPSPAMTERKSDMTDTEPSPILRKAAAGRTTDLVQRRATTLEIWTPRSEAEVRERQEWLQRSERQQKSIHVGHEDSTWASHGIGVKGRFEHGLNIVLTIGGLGGVVSPMTLLEADCISPPS
ncbi:hypothetical protein BAUCODRAFT_33831 [Baudoinia panamericana UAMH 10762]|uniref:Uncharacterized protein n=1 Tax=Baudoinia panamericana (strain UAMH 10762) TaxID=717646 RepID=M2LPZ0_BAUPA|nr:uncharacterized protein BAUCODRAFT_33831 [Baudoinia panamericana UAMH 10762]EMC96472.1 hypothetical protein BAUCODRAFT_33831 [Baudoinia panamericana UAMH 10762]